MVEEVETKLSRQDIRQDQSQHDFAADNFCPSDPNSFGRGPGYGIFGPQNSSQTMDPTYSTITVGTFSTNKRGLFINERPKSRKGALLSWLREYSRSKPGQEPEISIC
jgi:hypothetical protein